MAFDESNFYNQNSLMSISVMVVDDDPIFLPIMARMLEKSKYRDPSIMEITVIAAKNSMEALSTLKVQRHNIDLIVTDYYMPGMNGLQLKAEINREYGNLPIIVISGDSNIEKESLICGALCFIPKPIKPMDLTKIYELALISKRNGKSILQPEHNHKETNLSVPKQIQFLPEQTNVLKTKKKYVTRSSSRSLNNTNESVSIDGSRKNPKRKLIDGPGGDLESSRPSKKKKKMSWTDFLHYRFLQAIRHIGLDKAVPKKILEVMNVPDLTRENVASHLQKYRIFLRKVTEEGLIHSNAWSGRNIESMLADAHFRELYYNYFRNPSSWNDTSLNHSYSQPRHGFGQSRLLSNPRDQQLHFNQNPYNYMNRSLTYEPRHIGSNLTVPNRCKLNFSNQSSQNEGRRSFLEPPVMANRMGQTSQVLGFGQHGLPTIHGNSFNNNMMNNYGSSSLNQPRMSSYGSFTPNQPGLNSYRPPTLYQPGLSNYGSLTPNQLGKNIYGGSAPSQSGLINNYGSSTPTQPGLQSYGSSAPTQPGLQSYGSSAPTQPGLQSYGSSAPIQPGLENYGNSAFNQSMLNNYESLTPTQAGLRSYGSSTLNQPKPSGNGSVTPTQPGLRSYGNSTFNQPKLNSYQSLTPTQPGLVSYGNSTLNQPELSGYGSAPPNQLELSSYGSATPNQLGPNTYRNFSPNQSGPVNYKSPILNQPGSSQFGYGMQSFSNNENNPDEPPPLANATTQLNAGSQILNQPGSSQFGYGMQSFSNNENNRDEPPPFANATTHPNVGSQIPNQPGSNQFGYGIQSFSNNENNHEPPPLANATTHPNVESQILNQSGSSQFGYGMQSLSNNENNPYEPPPLANVTTQPNVEIPQLENLKLYDDDDLNKANELSCNISNFHVDRNQQQGEANNLELPAKFPTELNQFFNLGEDGDWNFVNKNQDHSNGETSNAYAAPETNSTDFNINPNHNQEQDPDFIDWSDMQDLFDDDFMDSLFNNDMN